MSGSGNWPHRRQTAASRNWETRTAQRRRRRSASLSDERVMRFALLAGLALVLATSLWLWNGRQAAADETRGLTMVTPVPTKPPTPTAAPTPTPAPRGATIVRLGGGPGMLHESPGFRTPVLSVVLREGDTVEVLDRAREDSEGNAWRLVAFGDTVGWSPENNLDLAR